MHHNGAVSLEQWTWTAHDERAPVWPGYHQQLGATWTPTATNFAVRAPRATTAWVCLFDDRGVETRHRLTEKTLGIWHGALPGVPVGQLYGFRVDGPWQPSKGLRFNRHKLLLDPYARAISGTVGGTVEALPHIRSDRSTRSRTDSAPYVPRSVVVASDDFDWGDDRRLRTRWRDTVIYELHVKGFTALHDRVPEELRGTYAGLATPVVLDYLRDLGVTAVELLPVHHFFSEPAVAARGMSNYWGYNSIGFFAPHGPYSAAGDRGEQVREFQEMVKAFHAAGIEVILDVVYNHTAEGGAAGPSVQLPGARRPWILPTLRLTGALLGRHRLRQHRQHRRPRGAAARAGLAALLGHRDARRRLPLRPRLGPGAHRAQGRHDRRVPHHDRAGPRAAARQADRRAVGRERRGLPGRLVPPPWTEWNDRFRDTLRDFWRAETGGVREIASRLAGSSDMYADDDRSPYASVNFVTAHDGFTVRDLLSYDRKHNEANGEGNRDGSDNNRSWNHGVEGPTDDPHVRALRRRQAANLLVTLCLSSGVPMLTAGDERGRTQRGNNNAYCQDNEISWIDWGTEDAWLDVYAVTRAALRLRREHPALRQRHHFFGRPTIAGGPKDLAWLHPTGREMTTTTGTTEASTRWGCSCPATRCGRPAGAASSCGTSRSCSG